MDSCLYSFYETSNGLTIDWSDKTIGMKTTLPAKPDWSDSLKFTSQLTNFKGYFGTVYSGTENCADLNNRCKNVSLSAKLWIANPGSLYPFTVKGGCQGITLEGPLQGHGIECDVDAGNWSDQNHDYVKDWELALTSTDGRPIIIRCLAADMPRLRPGTGPYHFIFPDPNKFYHNSVVAAFNEVHRHGIFS